MTLVDRLALIGDPLPNYLAVVFIDRINHPPLTRAIFRGVAVTIKTRPKGRLRIGADGSSYKYLIPPNDRARVCKTWNRSAPKNVLASLPVPSIWNILPFSNARTLRSGK